MGRGGADALDARLAAPAALPSLSRAEPATADGTRSVHAKKWHRAADDDMLVGLRDWAIGTAADKLDYGARLMASTVDET